MNKKEIEKAIEELKSYIEIWELEQADIDLKVILYKETIESMKVAIQALEKQIPKKPKYVETLTFPDTTRPILKYGKCPTCGELIDTDADRYYCEYKDCGQKLDWSGEE